MSSHLPLDPQYPVVSSDSVPLPSDVQRQRAIARIESSRLALRETTYELQRPLRTVAHLQQRARKALPVVLPGALLVGGIAWVLFRTIFGRSRRRAVPGAATTALVVQKAPRIGVIAAVLRALAAYRLALQLRELIGNKNKPLGASWPKSLGSRGSTPAVSEPGRKQAPHAHGNPLL